jgi:hypothetical protein
MLLALAGTAQATRPTMMAMDETREAGVRNICDPFRGMCRMTRQVRPSGRALLSSMRAGENWPFL